MPDPFAQFYSGAMAPPTRVNGQLVPTPTTTDWNDFYRSVGVTGTDAAGPDLTSRSVRTVAVDPFTGQPMGAGGSASNTAVAQVMRGDIQPKWADPSVLRFPQSAGGDRLPRGTAALPLNPSGQYNPGNPLVLAALAAQQKPNPAVAAATQMAQGGIKPSWANPPGFGPAAPNFPVAATPQVQMAYADVVAGKPGALKRYADLVADQAQAGNIGMSRPGGGGGPAPAPAVPTSIRGSSTGKEYQIGSTGTAGGYTYTATPGGFVNTGVDPSMAGLSAAQRYDTLNARAGNPTSSGNSSSLTSMGSSPQEGGTPDWVAHARPLYDSQGNISGWAKNVR